MTESTFQPTQILLTVEGWIDRFYDQGRVTAGDLLLFARLSDALERTAVDCAMGDSDEDGARP